MKEEKLFYTSDRKVWRQWLSSHFETENEVWLIYPMKGSNEESILYNDAVEETLCFGWIDSTIRHTDPLHRAQRFTPRNPKSSYSRPNIERLKWLNEQGLIHPKVKESLKETIEKEYVFPKDILKKIKKDPIAWENYQNFSEPYKRIRIAYIDAARKRPQEFEKRLNHFIKKTRENKLIIGYGGIEKYHR